LQAVSLHSVWTLRRTSQSSSGRECEHVPGEWAAFIPFPELMSKGQKLSDQFFKQYRKNCSAHVSRSEKAC